MWWVCLAILPTSLALFDFTSLFGVPLSGSSIPHHIWLVCLNTLPTSLVPLNLMSSLWSTLMPKYNTSQMDSSNRTQLLTKAQQGIGPLLKSVRYGAYGVHVWSVWSSCQAIFLLFILLRPFLPQSFPATSHTLSCQGECLLGSSQHPGQSGGNI